jgi:cell wall-associated NlpC family hydrolase
VYVVNRYFEVQSGQFLSVDPELQQTNSPYDYASNNPIGSTDSLGLSSSSGATESFSSFASLAIKYARILMNQDAPYYFGGKNTLPFGPKSSREYDCSGNGTSSGGHFGTVQEVSGPLAWCTSARWKVDRPSRPPVRGFDCSGLTQYVWKKSANIDIGVSSESQHSHTTPVNRQDLVPGDLVFYNIGPSPTGNTEWNGHVAMYIGNGNIIQNYDSGSTVSISRIDESDAWNNHDGPSEQIKISGYGQPKI